MRLRLDLDGIIFLLKVSDYVKTTKEDWDDKWCNAEGYIANSFLHVDLQGEILLSADIDWLANELDALLNDRLSEPRIIDCIEPVLSFVLYPKEDLRKNPQILRVQEGHEIKDISGEMIVHLWEDGALTGNSIHLALRRDDLQAILVYFRYVEHELTEQSVEVIKLFEMGVLQKEYSKIC